MTKKFLKNAQPIKCQQVLDHYNKYTHTPVEFDTYVQTWREWLEKTDNGPDSQSNQLISLSEFNCVDYTQGTTQAFDHFVLRHSKTRTIAVLPGEFQYHTCIGKYQSIEKIDLTTQPLRADHAVIISAPFSATGHLHPDFYQLLTRCNELKVPVCLDLSYWGISRNMIIHLHEYPCVSEIVSSLSKPFSVLANHRVGIRFSREYLDDGISMINETKMQNFHSMNLGVYFMKQFPAMFMWNHFGTKYYQLLGDYYNVKDHRLDSTDAIIFAVTSEDSLSEYNRGIPGIHRLCISQFLDEY
jgi:hypothetical protein